MYALLLLGLIFMLLGVVGLMVEANDPTKYDGTNLFGKDD